MTRKGASILLLVALALTLVLSGCKPAQPEELVIRYATDHSATQASAYAELDVLAPKLEELIPNAKVQIYQASSLYKPIESLNQLAAGNLEMTAVDSDGAGWDPWCNIFAQPMALTTVGAHMEYKNTSVAKAIEERMLPKGIRILGWMCESMLGGIGSTGRLLTVNDIKGKKLRISAALTQGPMVEAWGGSPVTMAWGDVPSALQTGVVDGVITSVGGFKNVKDLSPYYTVFGMGGVFTDFYMCAVSDKWWNTLSADTQGKIKEAFAYWLDEFYKMQYAEDMLGYEQFGTTDPTKPGIYIATAAEVAPLKAAVGTAIIDALVKELGADAKPLIEAFNTEGAALVAKYPTGTHPVEKINPDDYKAILRVS